MSPTTAPPSAVNRPAVPDILEEHLEELSFLAIRWRKLVFSPELSLRRLAKQQARIVAKAPCPKAFAHIGVQIDGFGHLSSPCPRRR